MIDASAELITVVMITLLIVLVGSGFPLGLALGGVALISGILFFGPAIFSLFYDRLLELVGALATGKVKTKVEPRP